MTASVRIENLGVRFQLDRQRRPVTPIAARVRRRCTARWALRNVDLTLGPGDSVALIGPNGGGKTTLLRAIAGVLVADEGVVEVRGRIGPLLSVEAGLMPLLTGRESARVLGVLAGLGRTESRLALSNVQRRSALGDEFGNPVSSYSQGMRARLGFAVAEEANSQILLLDEVHEAIDHSYQRTVAARASFVQEAGGIVIAAGHDHSVLSRLCGHAVRLENGRVQEHGTFSEVAMRYLADADGRSE